jgi:diaminohydroxyphosphoribosylaminopyrimidine deaminase/5-amino-6-(5-phosphoribosylamino)uracil reductase
MREDRTIDGGYITTKDSLTLVHKIRNNLDLLVIGGETVRVDRPTLDSRFSSIDKSPDILIFSNRDDFDNTIPLFSVLNREVQISNDITKIKDKNFVMIEGGYNLFESLKQEIDYLVIFLAKSKKTDAKFEIKQFGFEEIYRYKINDEDTIIFLKKS